MKTISVKISGRVQGVGFRYFVKQQADKTGISGFVKNLSDGSVYIEAQANETQLEEFLAACSKGPRFAIVTGIQKEEITEKAYDGFCIR